MSRSSISAWVEATSSSCRARSSAALRSRSRRSAPAEASEAAAAARAMAPRFAFQRGTRTPTENPFASLSTSLVRNQVRSRSGIRARFETDKRAASRSAANRAAARRGLVRARRSCKLGCTRRRNRERQLSLELERARERLDHERSQNLLRRLGLPPLRAQRALLPEPLHLGLDAVDLARLAQLGALRGQVPEPACVGLRVAGDLERGTRVEEPRERHPRVDLELPTGARSLGAQAIRGAVPGPGVSVERAGPWDGLRDRKPGFCGARVRSLGKARSVPREPQRGVGDLSGGSCARRRPPLRTLPPDERRDENGRTS